MDVGILEKSRRVRIARNSLFVVFDMLSPCRSWVRRRPLGSRARQLSPPGRRSPQFAKPSLWTDVCACSGSASPRRDTHLKRLVLQPQRSILRGKNRGKTFSLLLPSHALELHKAEAVTTSKQRFQTRSKTNDPCTPFHAAQGLWENFSGLRLFCTGGDDESALPDLIPGERNCAHQIGRHTETMDSRRPPIENPARADKVPTVCRLSHVSPCGPAARTTRWPAP